jgi:hypothetical protein
VFEVDVNEHMGESDAEMVAMIEGSLKKVIDAKIEGQKNWMEDQFKKFETQTTSQLTEIESILGSKVLDTGHFQQALKTEIEEVSEIVRKNNLESLTMMKGFATTLKSIKDNHRFLKESDLVSKDLIHQIIEYF